MFIPYFASSNTHSGCDFIRIFFFLYLDTGHIILWVILSLLNKQCYEFFCHLFCKSHDGFELWTELGSNYYNRFQSLFPEKYSTKRLPEGNFIRPRAMQNNKQLYKPYCSKKMRRSTNDILDNLWLILIVQHPVQNLIFDIYI